MAYSTERSLIQELRQSIRGRGYEVSVSYCGKRAVWTCELFWLQAESPNPDYRVVGETELESLCRGGLRIMAAELPL